MLTERRIAALGVAAAAIGALWLIPTEVADGQTGFAAGAAMLPSFAAPGVAALTLADAFLFRSGRGGPVGDHEEADARIMGPAQWRGLGFVIAAMAIYVAVLPWLGYLAPSAILVAALMRAAGGRRSAVIAAGAVGSAGLLFLGVRYGFGIYLRPWPDLALIGG